MKPVKFGVIGVGGMGGSHARNIGQLAEAEVVAVADVNEAAAHKMGAEVGAKSYSDYKALIRKGGVEAVIIATPHYFHPPIAIYAAQHGVHVLSEKPIAVSVAAADKMVQACHKDRVKLGVMFQQRTEASRRKMRDMITDGALGELHRVSMVVPWYRPQAYYNSGAWRGTWGGEGGGVLMNQAPHSMDQFVWMGGMPQSVQGIANTRLHQIEVENTALSIFDYGNGKVGWLYASTAEVPGGERIEVAGDKGVLVWEGGKLRHFVLDQPLQEHLRSATEQFGSPKGQWHDVPVEKEPAGHLQVVQAFARALREDDDSLLIATGEDGLRSLELANAMLMAGYTRQEVALPLDRGRFERMLKKLRDGVAPTELNQSKSGAKRRVANAATK
ncbi:MAG: Gfo/Idh/MocA family oxidoreductase [Abitibacteriaceae bacterium]|nr:Gfo/Idh/MocA family oxidoreductase [Abditibacteriaceae bacterium]